MHEGVGLLISNHNFSRFYIQQKDDSYPAVQWRGACSFWGGAIEAHDACTESAVWRELEEEIPEALTSIQSLTKVQRYTVPLSDSTSFGLTLFSAQLDDSVLDIISKHNVLEGIGEIMYLPDLIEHKWIFDMGFIFKDFLKQQKKI